MGSSSREALFLSPHLDDVVLSCGGQIHRRVREGGAALVLTVFAADEPPAPCSPFVEKLHRGFGLDSRVVARRRQEDQEACARLGARALHWNEREAIYRLDPENGRPLYPKYRHLFRRPRGEDRQLLDRLVQRFESLPEPDRVVVPLGIGRHVDHVLVRAAAEARFGSDRLSYYDDYPYSELWPWARFRAARPRSRWTVQVARLSEDDLRARVDAIAAYRSQLPFLFGTREDVERQVRAQVERLGGERLWRRRQR